MALAGCSSLGGTGPSRGAVLDSQGASYAESGIAVIAIDEPVLGRLREHAAASSLERTFGESAISATLIGPGDVLDIAIWEAPPAVLFGSSGPGESGAANLDAASTTMIPQQQVSEDGRVSVPFVGRIPVAGLAPEQVEAIIASRLNGRANNPQALVRLVQNESRTVTVLGEVGASGRMVLSARGERLLDALASAGGTSAPISETTIRLSRGDTQASMPLDAVIADPRQNVGLVPGDVITLEHKPFSFVALGAVAQSAEVPFEGAGISLAEALGRVGGLNDRRADVKGVFVFRMEEGAAIDPLLDESAHTTANGLVPVVYSLRMDDAQSLFAMQDFTMRDNDLLYVATAPGVELERFLSVLSSTAFSIVATANAIDTRQ
ncbi:capsular polysaccharide biosynthesis protein [Qipengyuania nanhaisediminis]